MVASLCKPGMSDQDKAVAIYNFMRRTMFHYRFYTKFGGGGAVNLINGPGYCLCTPTAGAQCEILEAAGIKARILDSLGHGSVAVFFDDKWHWMDAFLGGCLTGRDGKTLADLEEVVADPTLVKGEHTSPVPLFPCGAVLYGDALRWEPDNKKYHADCAPDDFDWATRSKPGKKTPTYWSSSMTLDITLRPGETFTRNWDGLPGMFFLHNTQEQFAPPHHFCGIAAEQRDPANWPYFKPYVKEITSFDPKLDKQVTVKTGRYWANGTLNWSPDLKSPDALKQFSRAENVQVKDGAIVPIDAAKPGIVEVAVRCPYMLQGGKLRGPQNLPDAGVTFAIAVDRNVGDKSPASQPEAQFVPLLFHPESAVAVADLRPHFAKEMGTRGYRLRFELAGAKARLVGFELTTVFQHNMYAQPQLMPGKNEIKVVVANPEALKATKFVVEFAWDGPDGKLKTERKAIDKSPFTFAIDIPDGPDLPRMRHLLLANEG